MHPLRPRALGWFRLGAALLAMTLAVFAITVVARSRRTEALTGLEASGLVFQGVVEPRHKTAVPSPVDGVLDHFTVKLGEAVAEGQVIAVVTDSKSIAALQRLQDDVKTAQSRVNDTAGVLAAARTDLETASRANFTAGDRMRTAQRQLTRQRELMIQGVIPRVVFEQANRDYTSRRIESVSAAARLDAARSRAQTALNASKRASAFLDQQTRQLEAIRGQVTAGEVRSPVAGVVAQLNASPGDPVSPAMRDLLAIATESQSAQVRVDATHQANQLQPGQPVTLQLADLPGRTVAGRVGTVNSSGIAVFFEPVNRPLRFGSGATVRVRPRP